MNSFVYQLLVFILIYIKSTHNYPSGAPPEICATMIPGHYGVTAQACSAKYMIRSDKSQYYTNETVRIIINGSTNSDTFRGILLIAKTASGQIIGSWSVVSSTIKTLACDSIANTGVTHNSRDNKTSIEAIWTPPSTISAGNTIIKATMVTTFNQIYVDCFSVTLTNRQFNQSTNGTVINTTSSSTTAMTTTTASQTAGAGAIISWTYTNGVTSVKMKINNLKTSQWLALGLSLDERMGEDHVFFCKRLSDDTVTLERRINPGSYSYPVVASPGGTFTPTAGRLENGAVYCEFTLSNFGSKRRRDISSLSQSSPYHPLVATGDLDSSNGPMKHTSRLPFSKQVQLNRDETIIYNGDDERIGLIKGHGIIMIFTWILFVSTGILIALYFKTAWPEKKFCGKAIWFAIHRALMTSVAVLTIIAFILILVFEKGKWVSRSDQREFAHSIVGIIIICFAVIQPIMALFRCKPDADYRFIFNYLHGFVGFTAFILSIVAIFLAMFFTQFSFEKNKQWGIIVAWTCWLPVIFLIFWFIEFYFRKYRSNGESTDSYDLGNSPPKNEHIRTRDEVIKDRIKLAFLIIHILVAFGLALALAIVIGNI